MEFAGFMRGNGRVVTQKCTKPSFLEPFVLWEWGREWCRTGLGHKFKGCTVSADLWLVHVGAEIMSDLLVGHCYLWDFFLLVHFCCVQSSYVQLRYLRLLFLFGFSRPARVGAFSFRASFSYGILPVIVGFCSRFLISSLAGLCVSFLLHPWQTLCFPVITYRQYVYP
jgi:hypothetical protein